MLRAQRLLAASSCLKSAWSARQTCLSCLTGQPFEFKPRKPGAAGILTCSGTGSLQPPHKLTAMEGWELGLDPVYQVLTQESLPICPLILQPPIAICCVASWGAESGPPRSAEPPVGSL